MSNDHLCIKCGRRVNYVEAGLTKKLINRGATKYFCLTCLSEKLKVSEETLLKRAEYFKKTGCILF